MMITSPLEHGGNIPSKKRIQLESKEGSYEYDSANFEGTVEICIQSYTASAENPSKVGFSVEPQSEKDEIEKLIAAERKLTSGKLEKLEAEQKVVAEETSRITYELARMQRRAKSIAVDAHFSKQREETFHYQSISLSRAVRNWPIARIVVLCLAGYMQLTHVVKFMKSRHIY